MWQCDTAVQLPSGEVCAQHYFESFPVQAAQQIAHRFCPVSFLHASATATGDFMPNPEALNAIRSWIAVGLASAPALGDDLTAGIPDDFVKQRQADSRVRLFPRLFRLLVCFSIVILKQVNAQYLGRWLTMAKLLARTNGLDSVTRSCWEEALRLDGLHRSP